MPGHYWNDEWFQKHGDDLNNAITYCIKTWVRWGRIGSHGKEKYGTFRDHVYFYRGSWAIHELFKPGHVWYRWPKWMMKIDLFLGRYIVIPLKLYKPIQWYQVQVYNYAIQKVCKRYPKIVDEIVADLDGYELVKPGIFGKIDGVKIHKKYWVTTEEMKARKTQHLEVGDNVMYEDEEYSVLGFAATKDEYNQPMVEIAWDNYNVSPTGYLAVCREDLRKLEE